MAKDYGLEYNYIKHETEKALLVRLAGGDEVWIPKSQVIDHNEEDKVLVVTEWIAQQKDLIP